MCTKLRFLIGKDMFICYHYYEKQTHSETYIYLIYISNITAQLPKRIKTSTTGTTVSVTELSTMNKNTTSCSSQNDFTHSLKLTLTHN